MGAWCRSTATLLGLALVVLSCGDDNQAEGMGEDEPNTTETAPSDTAPCAEGRQLVVFDYFHSLTMGRDPHDLDPWIRDPADEPEPRPGAAEVVQAYRDLGYEILYVHAAPNDLVIGEMPLDDAITDWLERHGFSVGDGAGMWSWNPDWEVDDPTLTPLSALVDELVRLGIEGVEIPRGYSAIDGRVEAFITGGVPRDHIFTWGEAGDFEGTTPIPDEDLVAHAEAVGANVDEVCQQ